MEGTAEVLVSVLWGTGAWFNLPITANAFQIQLSTRLLTAPLPTRSAAQPPTVVIQERCASKAVALPFPPYFAHLSGSHGFNSKDWKKNSPFKSYENGTILCLASKIFL